MTLFLISSIVCILLGGLCLLFPRQIGVGFCRAGKRFWKTVTFGFTDMRWFYTEDNAPLTFRLVGAGALAVGVTTLSFWVLSFFGPGVLCAMREASNYLKQTHGSSAGYQSIVVNEETDDSSIVRVTYSHGEKSGELRGEWNGQKYLFNEGN